MYISLKDSRTKGFRKQINKEVRADEGDREVDADPDLDNRVMSSADRPHRPWLVPGAGTL
jgi:hypothetical protein